MSEYHKIQSIYMRDRTTNRFIDGCWSTLELGYLHDKTWTWDEKIDGTNIRIEWDGTARTFRGRTDKASIPAVLFERLEALFPAEAFAREFTPGAVGDEFTGAPTKVVFYGEGFGEKIQRGGNYLPGRVDFILFDVRIGRWWLLREDVESLAGKFGCLVTPIVGEGPLAAAIEKVRAGFPSAFGTAQAEGLVLRPKVALLARSGERIITKVKTVDFK